MAEITKAQLVELAQDKLRDAKILFAAGRATNAYYLAGYSVELMLKAILSGRFRENSLPDRSLFNQVFTHDLEKLVRTALLDTALKERQKDDPDFQGYWQVVLGWSEESRYGVYHLDQTKALLQAIEDQEHGVLPWLHDK